MCVTWAAMLQLSSVQPENIYSVLVCRLAALSKYLNHPGLHTCSWAFGWSKLEWPFAVCVSFEGHKLEMKLFEKITAVLKILQPGMELGSCNGVASLLTI